MESKKSSELSTQNELRRLQRQLREAGEAVNDTATKDGKQRVRLLPIYNVKFIFSTIFILCGMSSLTDDLQYAIEYPSEDGTLYLSLHGYPRPT